MTQMLLTKRDWKSVKWLVLTAAVGIFSAGNIVSAASLTWSNATAVTFTSPAVTATIAAGSVADSLTAGASNLAVTLSAATGGSFTVTSATSDLNYSAPGAAGAGTSHSCVNNIATVTVAQPIGSQVYTITPSGTPCASIASGGGGGGPMLIAGGLISASTSSAVSPAQLVITPVPASATTTLVVPSIGVTVPLAGYYKTNLVPGAKGSNIIALQNFLKLQGTAIYPEGKVTGYYGKATMAAVGRFQLRYGIVKSVKIPGYGKVGPKTRAKINQLLGLRS